jgi:hypothetical protein
MTDEPTEGAVVLPFHAGAMEEKLLNDMSLEDIDGPLPCGCFRIEVYDFGHRAGHSA